MIPFAIVVALGTLTAGCSPRSPCAGCPRSACSSPGSGSSPSRSALAAVLFSGVVMFDSDHDFDILLVAAGCSTAAFGAALLVGGSILRSLDRVRGASAAIARGDLSARAPEDGPSELAELAASFNEMATSVEALRRARSSRGRATTSGLRSRRCRRCSKRSRTAWSSRSTTCRSCDGRSALGLLVDDLFELARLDAGVLTLDLLEAPIGGLVRSALGGLEAEAQTRRVALAARIDADPPSCAPDKVERVLLNLLTNAIRHTPSDGAVAVIVEPLDGDVRVSVEDTGDGIPPESIKRVFDHFWRGDRSRTGAGNAGLGLAIARADPGPGRPDLGREPLRGRRKDLLHAAASGRHLLRCATGAQALPPSVPPAPTERRTRDAQARTLVLALVVGAAFLALAGPAMASGGGRGDGAVYAHQLGVRQCGGGLRARPRRLAHGARDGRDRRKRHRRRARVGAR